MKNIYEDDTVARTLRNASQLTMKVLYVAFAVVSAVSALQTTYNANVNEVTSGLYYPDDSGRYVPDDSGRYIPDRSGDYIPDGLGGYLGDGSGIYGGDNSGAYKGDGSGGYKGGAFGGAGGGGSGSGGGFGSGGGGGFGSGRGNRGSGGSGFLVRPSFGGIGSTNLLGSGSNENKQTVKPTNPYGSGTGSGAFGNSASATTSQVASKGSKFGGSQDYSGSRYADGRWKIIRQTGDVDTDGYHWEYETENGITAEESGKLANKGSENEAMRAKGFYQYTGDDNARYYVSYTSDENGFLPEGDHLPTPPPIPGPIVRSLEFLKSIGKL